MKEIVAKNQVELGPARCLQLALSGIMFRLFRSSITIAILGLAVAFLSHMLAYSVMSGATSRAVWQEMEQERSLGTQLRRLESPDPLGTVLLNLQRQHPERAAEYRAWADLSQQALDDTVEKAVLLGRVERTIQSWSPRHRAILAGDRDDLELLDHVRQETSLEAFLRRLEQTGASVPLGEIGAFEEFVGNDWPALSERVRDIRSGHRRALTRLDEALEGRGVFDTLIRDPARMEELSGEVGFSTEGMNFERLSTYARDTRTQRQIEESLGNLGVRRELARRIGTAPADITPTLLFNWITESDSNAIDVADQLAELNLAEPASADEISRVAANALHQRRLQNLVPREPDVAAAESFFGLDESSRWLIGLAFMVCVIGVANAMLMSVTERFTEIATMKCLGAMDKFIMMMFVFESAIQGLIGGVLGALLGLLLAWIRGVSEFGGNLVVGQVTATVVVSAILSLVVGILLAVFAAVGPAFAAARLAPMEAMRVD